MGLTRLAINRPLAMLMFIIALVIMGVVALSLLKVDRLPAISFPFVSVNVPYPGASPADVEALIAKPLEAAMSGISGIQTISSNSFEGRAQISLQLVEGADAQAAAIDADRRMASIRGRLPTDIGSPSVNRADPNAFPIMNIALSGQRPISQIYDLAVNTVQPKLQSVLGVADINVSGGVQREIQIQVDFAKMESYGISIQQVTTALQRENVGQPAGSIQQGRQSITVRSMGGFQAISDIANTQITTGTSSPIRVRDIAKVEDTLKPITRYQRLNGDDAVGLSITKQSDANSIQVADDLRKAIATLQNSLPADVQMRVTNDTTFFTRASLAAVQVDLSLAILLTASVLILFLHTWRNVLIVILAIPTSLISTFLAMYVMGFTLNIMSLMALALLIGILVDDSIVVLENINRHIRLGARVKDAALTGRSEIGMAAIAITLADVVVYMPIAFIQGNLGKLFREYGLTIAVATIFSLFIGFTLTPMLASRWLKEKDEQEEHGTGLWARFIVVWEGWIESLAGGYRKVLSFSLDHRPLIALVGLLSLVAALSFIPLRIIGTEYAPTEDDGNFRVNINMPSGTVLEATDLVARQVEAIIRDTVPEVQSINTSVTGGANIDVQVTPRGHPWWLKPWEPAIAWYKGEHFEDQRSRPVSAMISDLRRRFTSIPEASIQISTNQVLTGGGWSSGLQVRILGADLDTLKLISSQIEGVMRATPGVADVRSNATTQLPEVRAIFDRARMAELGITTQQVTTALRTALSGTVVSSYRAEGQDQLDMTLIAESADRLNPARLADLPITQTIAQGTTAAASTATIQTIRLGQIARFELDSGPAQIQRQDRQRSLSLSGTIAQGATLGDVAREFRENMASQIQIPAGYSYLLVGQAAQLDVAMSALMGALGLSILLIYMLLVGLYESWLHPLAIMFSLPVSLIGAFGGLWLTGNTFNIFSMIGMIMLMGLVAKNAILLIDFTNTLRARGMSRRAALEEAGPTRLRPILMTTATILFAMLPLAAKLEEGSESRAPLAVVVMGGVISSTLLTLVFVPVMYAYLDDLQEFFYKRGARGPRIPGRGRRTSVHEPVEAAATNGSTTHAPIPSGVPTAIEGV